MVRQLKIWFFKKKYVLITPILVMNFTKKHNNYVFGISNLANKVILINQLINYLTPELEHVSEKKF